MKVFTVLLLLGSAYAFSDDSDSGAESSFDLRSLFDQSPFFARLFSLATGEQQKQLGPDGNVPTNLIEKFFNNPLISNNPVLQALLSAFLPGGRTGARALGEDELARLLLLGGGGGGEGGYGPATNDNSLGSNNGFNGLLGNLGGGLSSLVSLLTSNPVLSQLFADITGYSPLTLLENKFTLVREVFCVFFTSEAVSGDVLLSKLFNPHLQLFSIFFGETCQKDEAYVAPEYVAPEYVAPEYVPLVEDYKPIAVTYKPPVVTYKPPTTDYVAPPALKDVAVEAHVQPHRRPLLFKPVVLPLPFYRPGVYSQGSYAARPFF